MSYLPSQNGRRAALGFIGRTAKPLRGPRPRARGLSGASTLGPRGRGMGETFDVTPMAARPEHLTPENIKRLQVELNRYVGSPLGALVPNRIKVSGVLDQATAFAAWSIILKRAADAIGLYGKLGESRPLQILAANAAAYAGKPVEFISKNVKEATEVVGMIADQNGLPQPLPTFVTDSKVLLGAGILGAALILAKAKVL